MTRKIIDSVIANPIPVVFGMVMVTCVTVLVSRINSDDTDMGSNQGIKTSVSKSYDDKAAVQHYDDELTKPTLNSDRRFQSTSKNTNRSLNNGRNNSDDDDINDSGFNNTDNQARSSDTDVSTQTNINQTNISFPAGFVDTSSSNLIDSTIDNTASPITENDTNPAVDPNDNAEPSDDENPEVEPAEPDIACTATSEHTVQIDLDETQTISCCSIVANGPACMCTLTTTDASGTFAEVMNNCGS